MRELMSYLPEGYERSPETVAIQEAIQPELKLAWQARDDMLRQLNPNTATWGLRYWEEAFGLPVNETRPVDQRRVRVIGRLRGRGTTTVALLKSVVEVFCPGCQVAIVEVYDKYLVEIHLTSTDAFPADLYGLRDELNLIMPAHLGWGLAATLESTGTAAFGACSEMAGRLEVWPLLVTAMESAGTAVYGAYSRMAGCAEAWPLLAREIESVGAMAAGGTQEYQAKMEIYPLGGMANG